MTDIPSRVPKLPTTIALLVALAGPPLFVLLPDRVFGESPSLAIQVVLQILYCGLAGVILWIVVRHERLPLRSIGLRRPDWSTLVTAALLAGVGLFLLPLLTGPLMNALGSDGVQTGVQRLASLPVWFRVVLGVTGGIVEEILYRGYAVERLATMTGRTWLGATIAVLAFAVAHIPMWGVAFALGADLPFGIVMTLAYMWRRDLIANILAHSTGLVVAMLTLGP